MIDDYIQLPSLSEVFIELVPGVQPVTRNKKRSLTFNGNVAKQNFIGSFDPLILLDQVPVYDLEKLLALSPQKLYSIEAVNELYYLGDITYRDHKHYLKNWRYGRYGPSGEFILFRFCYISTSARKT